MQARNKASQALREGAPELREELRDQQRVGPDVKLPYQGNRQPPSLANVASEASSDVHVLGDKEEMAARAAAARELFLSSYGPPAGATRLAVSNGRSRDPPETAGKDEDATTTTSAAMKAAAEEKARRLMMQASGAGVPQHLMSPNFRMGNTGGMNSFFAGSSAAQLQAAAAFRASAAGGAQYLSPQAMMIAGGQPSAVALLHANRARELSSQIDAANFAAGVNPMLLAGQHRARGQFHDSIRYHDLVNVGGSKRDREDMERAIEENYAKAAKVNRPFR